MSDLILLHFWKWLKKKAICNSALSLLHCWSEKCKYTLASVPQGEKTIHANLPPQTGVQLGQSGVESSGVEGADRPRSGRWLRRGDLLWRTMMAAQLSDDGGCCGCCRRPNQQCGLTWPLVIVKKVLTPNMCARGRASAKMVENTLCVSHKGARGSTLAACCSVT